ncbi:DUF6293 family protein [Leptothoe sp. ISB3NOV94-8A]
MGVFHLMGLGKSPGVISAPISYLSHRYKRWDESDRQFFAYSGEVEHREENRKVGDVQGIVIFSTVEVISGKKLDGSPFNSFDYLDNRPGETQGKFCQGRSIKSIVSDLLPNLHCKDIFGNRSAVSIFWCHIDRRDVKLTYDRIIQTVASLASVGGQGKEMWVNLTGGSNPVNFALQLATTLSGSNARMYYVQAQNAAAEKCVHFTAEENYWLELPILPLALGDLSQAVLSLLEKKELSLLSLYEQLQGDYWKLMQGYTSDIFREEVLKPLWKRMLIVGSEAGYSIGPQWSIIKPYRERWNEVQESAIAIETLAKQVPWLEHQTLLLQ